MSSTIRLVEALGRITTCIAATEGASSAVFRIINADVATTRYGSKVKPIV